MSYSAAVQSLAPVGGAPQETGPVTPLNPLVTYPLQRESFTHSHNAMALKAYIVEDNALIRDNLMDTMNELLGIQVLGCAATEQAARDWLSSHSRDWQLLVVDLFLLEGSGLGVINYCANRSPQQRVVVLSNYATDEIRFRCMASGADAVFDKSTELDQFLAYCAVKH